MIRPQLIGTLILSTALAWSLSGCFAPALILVGSGVVVGANTMGSNLPLKTQEEDTHIKMQAVASLKNYPDLEGHSNIEITVYNGVVLLLGQVPSSTTGNDIAQNIAKIEGVNAVYNEMTVTEPSSIGTYAEDTWITTKVKTALGNAHLNSLHFKIITENRVVYLLAVTTPADGDAAAIAASKVSGVQKVVKAYFYTHTDTLPTQSQTSTESHTS